MSKLQSHPTTRANQNSMDPLNQQLVSVEFVDTIHLLISDTATELAETTATQSQFETARPLDVPEVESDVIRSPEPTIGECSAHGQDQSTQCC